MQPEYSACGQKQSQQSMQLCVVCVRVHMCPSAAEPACYGWAHGHVVCVCVYVCMRAYVSAATGCQVTVVSVQDVRDRLSAVAVNAPVLQMSLCPSLCDNEILQDRFANIT